MTKLTKLTDEHYKILSDYADQHKLDVASITNVTSELFPTDHGTKVTYILHAERGDYMVKINGDKLTEVDVPIPDSLLVSKIEVN